MVRLACPDGNDRIRTVRQRLPEQEFEFSELVAAATDAVQIFSFDEDVDTAQLLAEPRKVLNRCGPFKQRVARKGREIECISRGRHVRVAYEVTELANARYPMCKQPFVQRLRTERKPAPRLRGLTSINSPVGEAAYDDRVRRVGPKRRSANEQ